MDFWVGTQGQATSAKKAQKHAPCYDVTHREPQTKKQFLKIQTKGLVESVEGLNSSLAQSAGELRSCKVGLKKMCRVGFKGLKIIYTSFFWHRTNSRKVYAKIKWEHCKFQPAIALRILVQFEKLKVFFNQNDEISLFLRFDRFCLWSDI